MKTIKLGIVGSVDNNINYKMIFENNGATLHAVSNDNYDELLNTAELFESPEVYCDYDDMITNADIDAVIINSPIPFHAEHSIKALNAGKAVLCETTAGINIDECKRLTECVTNSAPVYMMSEDAIYSRKVMLITELVKQGLFGDIYYAEGEYLSDSKEINDKTPWQRQWLAGVNGITYGTSSLGPILQWIPGDKIIKVCCEGGGYHHADEIGEKYQQESPVMLCKTEQGRMIKIRVDLLSDRPNATNNYLLQGTDGVFESSRGVGESDKIWLRKVTTGKNWISLDSLINIKELAGKYLPNEWSNTIFSQDEYINQKLMSIRDFLSAVRGDCIPKIGIHEAMDITLPGLISQQAIIQNSWLNVPDSRKWATGELPPSQLRMTWPKNKPSGAINIPDGYQLRQFDYENDKEQYLQLMINAGFDYWKAEKVTDVNRMAFPGCFFIIEHVASKKIVATAHGLHNCNFGWSNAAELSWVAGDAEHKGKGLGYAVCMAVIKRVLEMGYSNIFLLTDDFRIPAISVYLKMGFEPAMYREDMPDRWEKIAEILGISK